MTAATSPSEAFDLDRFTAAQDPVWNAVLAELRAGRKQTHWMWFVFPQLATLGRSDMARHYGLSGMAEAKAYLAHPVLGPRLRQACDLLLQLQAGEAVDIFGAVDAMKLRSCLTLFATAAPDDVFSQCLGRYFAGSPDRLTLQQIG
jgi:uncharacterized protein (DUF1810 family)